jgi:hypothetical protein
MANEATARSSYKCCSETLLSIRTWYALLVAISVLAVCRLVGIRLRGSVRRLRGRWLVWRLALLVGRTLLRVGSLLIWSWGVCRRGASVVWLRRVLILIAPLLLCVVRSRRILSLALWRVLLLAVGSLLAIGSLLVAVIVVVRHGVWTLGTDVM